MLIYEKLKVIQIIHMWICAVVLLNIHYFYSFFLTFSRYLSSVTKCLIALNKMC